MYNILMARVLCISDTQAPFQHPDTLHFLEDTYDKYKCDSVIHIGDEVDNKFLKYLSINDPHSAIEQHEMALEFMHQLYKSFPFVRVCHSNHVLERMTKAAESAMIPAFMMKSVRECLEAPKTWRWQWEWKIDGVLYSHGHRWGGMRPHAKAVECMGMSCVIGHHPVLGVEYFNKGGKIIAGMCVGAMTINLNDARLGYGMKYSRQYAKGMPLGCGVIIDGKQLIPVPFIK